MEPTRPGTRRVGRMRVTPEAAETLRRDGGATEDEKLLERRPDPSFLDTDPWRVLRIQSEFVEGFDAMADGRAGGDDLRLGPDAAATIPRYELARTIGRRARRGRLRGHHRRRPGHDGGGQPRLPGGRRAVGRLQHRAAPRAGAQRVRRPRRRVPLLLRAQDDVREVRRRLRHPARRVRDARRAVRGAHPHPDRQGPPLPGRAGRPGVLVGAARLGPRHAPARPAPSPDVDLDLFQIDRRPRRGRRDHARLRREGPVSERDGPGRR